MNKLYKIINLWNKNKEIINYLIFGGLTTVINVFIYCLITFWILDANDMMELQIANGMAWILSVLFAYITNKKYVFKSKSKRILREVSSFFGSRVFTLILEMIIMFVGVSLFMINDKVIKIISQIVVIIGNYLLSKMLVFVVK